MKSINFIFIFFPFMLFNGACSSFQKWQEKWSSNASLKRTFKVKKIWIQPTPSKEIVGFRKINRTSPLLYLRNNKNWVIQANSFDSIAAYDRSSGRETWRTPIPNGIEASISIINDRLFFGSNGGVFYSLDATTGEILWTFPTRMEVLSEPLVHEGVVYFLNGSNTLYALDASNGKQLWLYSRQDPNALSIRGGARPTIKDDSIFIGFSDGTVAAIYIKNGAIKWEKQLNRNKRFRDLDSNILVENNFLYLLGYDDAAYCLRTATGEVVWKSEKGGYGSFLSTKDRLYFPTTNSEFVALDKETGQRAWIYKLKEGIATPATFFKSLLVFGESQGDLLFVDARNGKPISSFTPGKGLLAAPTVDEANQSIFFISNEANLYHLNAGWESL